MRTLGPKMTTIRCAFALAWTCWAASPSHAAPAKGFDCLIEPKQVVELRSPVEGLIDRISVDRGDFIKKGQVLVELESTAERSSVAASKHRAEMVGRVASSRNRVEFATKKLERSQQLLKESFVSTQTRDEAETEHRLAESELKDALETQELARLEYLHAVDQLKQRSLKSPFDGYVVDRMLHPGDLAESGTGRKPILKIAQIDPLRVEVVLPQEAFGRVAVGTTASIAPEGFPGSYPARVTVVDKLIDAASGMFGVRLELANPKGALPGGIRCAVEFPGLKPNGPAGARLH